MDALAASLVAVFGTALGAALTHVFQRRNALRAESVAREERLRQERVAAFSSFAGALADYRRGQLDHWYARRREEPGAEQLRRKAARLRAVALEAMFRAELLTDSAELAATGRRALKESDRMDLSRTREELEGPRARSREAVYAYVAAARGWVPGAQGLSDNSRLPRDAMHALPPHGRPPGDDGNCQTAPSPAGPGCGRRRTRCPRGRP
ncbi:hypothetical protein [Streptomyces sp. CLI2509]|uniref:hypothetical protein n=2 Tax=unclassified Streptomyces TaxID=2593676 RepID=UPI001F31AF37|nr:hypothetical protein [Streptomyces sp. CLI2509]